ncbi:MAG: hypothetical protein IKE85_04595 [Mogibacterium sp.]|nr:hypothetical protein [Mogibacterium sp.]
MKHKTRLGPVAIFLTVVVMVITTLAVLTVATSNADRIMAGRFARVTEIRYQLESDGQRFLTAAANGMAAGFDTGNVTQADNGYTFEEEKDGYRIFVDISAPDANGEFDIREWRITKIWNADDPMSNIWQGF